MKPGLNHPLWSAALTVLLGTVAMDAFAQETEKVWSTRYASGGPFLSESATHDAIRDNLLPSIRDSRPLNLYTAGQTILKDRTVYRYELSPELVKIGDWQYAGGATSYEAAVAQVKARYDQESTQAGCAPDTTLAIDPWQVVTTGIDGSSDQEEAAYTATYRVWDFGTVCKTVSKRDSLTVIIRSRAIDCPNTTASQWDPASQTCVGKTDFAFDHRMSYTSPVLPKGQCPVGNPCDPSTGDKMQPETDFELGWISFTRYFHSLTSTPMGGFGDGWIHSHNLRLTAGKDPSSSSDTIYVGLIEADGSQLSFTQVGTAYESDDGRGDRVVADGTQWRLFRSDRVLRFDTDGRLLEQQFENGTSLVYGYDPMLRLSTITHSSGRNLTIEYTGTNRSAPIAAIRSAGYPVATYTYTAAGQIETVSYANSTNRLYHYEDTRFPRYLTGVTIEGNQRFSTFAYDAKGRVISSQHDGGADGVTLSYPATGGSIVTDALGHSTTFALTATPPSEAPRKIRSLTDTRGAASTTYYGEANDFRRRVNVTTDRKGVQTKHAYAEANDPVTGALARTETVTEAVGKPQQRISTTTTDVASNRAILSKIGNRETRIARNARLQPVSVIVRDTVSNQTRTVTYAYCEAADVAASNSTCPRIGLLKSVDGPRTDVNDITRFEYFGSDDSTCAATPELCTYRKGDLRKTIDALGRATEIVGYDPDGRPLSVIDANGLVTDFSYTLRGWLTATKERGPDDTTHHDDRITEITYYLDGLVQTVTPPGQPAMSFDYDGAQRLNYISDGGSNRIAYTLDNAGNVKKQENQNGSGVLTHTLSRVYNALGQLITAKDAAQNATSFAYDLNGNLELTTDALGRKTSQAYDPLDRLSRTLQDIDGLAVETKMDYNALDQVTKVTDPKGLETLYAYNGFGEQTKLTSPDTGVTDYTYTIAGLLASKKDANDVAAHRYAYDVLNRPTAVFYTASGPADVEYDYDTVNPVCASDETSALGRVTAMRAEGTALQYCYDRFGQIVRKVQTVAGKSFTLRYAYNKAGLLQAVTYPDGAVADYWRDGLGRIQEIQVTPVGGVRTKLLGSGLYQPFGPSIGWSFGNGRHFAIDSDLDYRTQSIRDSDSGGLSLGYVYNEVGEIKELKDGLLSASLAKYDYDTLGRLKTTRDGPTGTPLETYGYDATGNRTSLLRSGITDTYNYPSTSHRLSSIGATARSYDAVGNTIAIGGTAKEYVYNANDRMKQVKQGGVVTMGYRYNAKGERVAAITADTGPVTTYTLYDEAGHWIGDYDSSGAAIQQAIWMEDAPVGLLAGAGSAQSLKYVQPDHLGTPRAVIDPVRNVAIWTWDAKSEAFGNSPPNQDPDLDGAAFVFNMRFPGQRHDPATGLVYNYFRDYDPATGRYFQSDPIGLNGGINTFAYVGGSPFQFSDSFGLASVDNWENKYVHKVRPPKRSPDDWLGPTIGVALGVIAAPAILYAGAEIGALWLANPITANNAAIIAGETITGTSVGVGLSLDGRSFARVCNTAASRAGSIRSVNAIGGKVNCVNCTIATDSLLAGSPASALGGGPFKIKVLEEIFGRVFGSPSSIEKISKAMSAAGPGSRGIVFGSRGADQVGHVFNVVNQNGAVRFLDGQTGRSASLNGYESFQLLRTN